MKFASPVLLLTAAKATHLIVVDDYREADGSGRVIKRVQGQADCDLLGDGLVFSQEACTCFQES